MQITWKLPAVFWSSLYFHTFVNSRAYCEEVVTVSEAELCSAMGVAFDNGLVVEPSGAAALAAFLNQKIKPYKPDENIVIVLTGGNITAEDMAELCSK